MCVGICVSVCVCACVDECEMRNTSECAWACVCVNVFASMPEGVRVSDMQVCVCLYAFVCKGVFMRECVCVCVRAMPCQERPQCGSV